jgi:hypothetical protein
MKRLVEHLLPRFGQGVFGASQKLLNAPTVIPASTPMMEITMTSSVTEKPLLPPSGRSVDFVKQVPLCVEAVMLGESELSSR